MKADRQALILENATLVLLKKGLLNTSMEDIASECQMTRRTLYRYFDTKEDLAFEVAIRLLNEWNDYCETIFRNLTGMGIEKLSFFLKQLVGYMENKIQELKYLGEFDFYFRDDRLEKPSDQRGSEFNDVILKSDEFLKSIIVSGITDGSIKSIQNIDLTVATISNVLWSFGQRIALRGHIIENEYGVSSIALILNQVNMYIIALGGNDGTFSVTENI